MNRWLPHPLMSLTLTLVWLLLVNDFGFGQLLLGALFGLLIPHFTSEYWPERPHLQRPLLLARYLLSLAKDIITANLQVARLVLGPREHLRPAFIEYELELTDEFAITVLASTVSLTPGTVSADLSIDRRTLLIHSLDVSDRDALCRQIRTRYEAPLKEIFK
ncbi:Na+/H+ antiporter subunit E [Thiohalomonas denitrificans]|uniref:Multicomponent K+:H+ antiporter subunit E n=1 Tax=Thiohalomonas denitrificans TaxID=415747 RepID=A0A1G5Q3T7_9GAMM|nr:Na+/H+ antiporter subunit E [Thiohalomonas denitrificans]SCZ56216.1 multicomponent K+:H+ antiporter subunit E [Thiohalomonas denitrificans]